MDGGREEANAPATAAAREGDLQRVLARAAARLATSAGAARVFVWERGPGPGAAGEPAVRAACLGGGALCAPSAGEFEALAQLPAAADLGAPGAAPALRALAARHHVAAACPVPRGEAGPGWVILAGGGRWRAGAVAPRDLARLAAAAERLAAPTAVEASLARLARLDADVRRLDRLAAVGGLVAEIVHEIRNPLVSVKTFLQLLPERGGEPEFQESFLRLASEELRRVERLLDLVLDHARPATDDAPAADLAASVASVVQLVGHRAAERAVRLADESEPALPRVALSADALRQVLLNLVLNAIDASPEGGCVRVAARRREGGVELSVTDEGPGIPPDHRPHLFEPFFSTKPGRPGGLGLAVSRRIATEAGGQLGFETGPEGGTRFVLLLPEENRKASVLPDRSKDRRA